MRSPAHGGVQAVEAARHHGVDTLFTLSGAHVFPLYDAAVGGASAVQSGAAGPLRLVDVRHEQTAVFAAEATGKLTRTPGFAVVTAGPGVTNAVSAVAGAWVNGSPLVLVGGRAPDGRWGSGALQEIDHPPLLAPVTKAAHTVHDAGGVGPAIDAAFRVAGSAHRGPVFVDVPMDVLFTPAAYPAPEQGTEPVARPDDADIARIAELLRRVERPVMVLGSDVWADGADAAARTFADASGIPVIANGMARGILPPDHPLLVTRARGAAFTGSDLVMVVGTPLDFRLGYGRFGDAPVIHVADSPGQLAPHVDLAASAAGDLSVFFLSLARTLGDPLAVDEWATGLRERALAAIAADAADLASDADPIHPARIYGELLPRLADDAVIIGDGGDFVSFAGRYVEPRRPGHWLDPGPYGCLGTGPGYAMAARLAHPSSQVVLLLGDGAAGFSLMDVDSLVRHDLPVVIVIGNNSGWNLERHPMRFLYGYDVAAELRPTAYDDVVKALGGAGETVTRPQDIGTALDRAFDSAVPYVVNVMTDPQIAYPRSTTGV
ncbi:MAG: acetolactate synthase [Candidatus Nanopelagicales bacterium]